MGVLMAFTFGFLAKSVFAVPFVFFADFLMSRYRKRKMTSYYLSTIFALSLSPVFTYIWTQQGYNVGSFMIAGVVMMLISALMSQISGLTSRVHEGYTIANGAAAAGFIAVVTNGLLNAFYAGYTDKGYEAQGNSWGDVYKEPILIMIIAVSALFLLVALIAKDYKNKFSTFQIKDNSRLPVDYIAKYGFTFAIFNLLIITWAAIAATAMVGATFNAYVVAAIFQVMSFGAFGKTFKNAGLVVVGVMIGYHFFPHVKYNINIAWAIALYATLLSPTISLGIIFPVLAGMIHIAVIPIVTGAHGSLLLYNNGMTSLFVSVVLLGVYKSFSWKTIRKTEENAGANASEKLKTVNVATELLFFIINKDIGHPELQYSFSEKESKIIFTIKSKKDIFKGVTSVLNKTQRDISYETEFWPMLGKDPSITNIDLLGKMIDVAEQEKTKDGYIITITRHI